MDDAEAPESKRARVRELLEGDPPLLTLPPAVREGRFRVEGAAVRGVLIVVVVALLAIGGRYLLTARGAEASPSAVVATGGDGQPAHGALDNGTLHPDGSVQAPATASGGSTGTPPQTGASPGPGTGSVASPSAAAVVTVHVAGRVREPGVVTVAADSRVADAVELAGGPRGDADLAAVNLARPLVDGEQILVPKLGDAPTAQPGSSAPGIDNPGAGVPGAGVPGSSSPTGDAQPGLVNLNTADQAALETLPGVGPVMAGAIIAWREENGGFTSVDELHEISGIGEKTFAKLAPLVTL